MHSGAKWHRNLTGSGRGDAVKEWNYPYAKWFINAQLNITANCLDRHVNSDRRNKAALDLEGRRRSRNGYSRTRNFSPK